MSKTSPAKKATKLVDSFRITERLSLQAFSNLPEVHTKVASDLESLRASFNFEAATPVEQLLISQVVTCWAQYLAIGYVYEACTGGSYDISQAEHLERRYQNAHARFIKAAEALARVQKLNLPSIQVNFAEKQINISGR